MKKTKEKIANLSKKEVKSFISSLKNVFDMVAIVNPKDKKMWDIDKNGDFAPIKECFCLYNKTKPFENCPSLKAITDMESVTRFETIDGSFINITSRPIYVDGELFALETSSRLDKESYERIVSNALNKSSRQRDYEIIEILASEYSSVYYIDLTTDELNPYTMNAETESEFGQIFNSGITYSEAFKMYVDRLIYPDDKAMMLKNGSVENIKKQLTSQKTFITQYRSSDNRYSEMKFVKVGDEDGIPKAVALGFADRDEEIRRKQEQEIQSRRNTEIIEILASEYSSVYYIDLTTDELDPYTMNEETESEFGHIFRSGIKYSDAFQIYVNTLVFDEDKAMMLKAGSIYHILEELQDKKSFVTTYRSSNSGNPRYCEMKFVKVGDDENPQAVALGFADKDDIIRKEIEEKEEREKNFEIIDILASEYTSVYYIDLNSDELTNYTMNDKTKEFFEDSFNRGITYSEAFKMYVDNAVAEESKPLMLKAGSIENIRKQLARQKTFITTYLNDENKYSEMKFVKVGGDYEEPQAVALGFSIIDDV